MISTVSWLKTVPSARKSEMIERTGNDPHQEETEKEADQETEIVEGVPERKIRGEAAPGHLEIGSTRRNRISTGTFHLLDLNTSHQCSIKPCRLQAKSQAIPL